MHLTMRELPESEQPRHRIADAGPRALSDSELLAIILGSGAADTNALQLAQHLLAQMGGWPGLISADTRALRRYRGIGHAKAAQIIAAIEIGRRTLLASSDTRIQIRNPTDMATILMREYGHRDQEYLVTAILDTKRRLVAIAEVYKGSLDTNMVRICEVFKEAVKRNAASIIVCHNHPSNDCTPSPEDVLVTREIVAAGQLLDINVLDHLVVGRDHFVSLRERGLGFAK